MIIGIGSNKAGIGFRDHVAKYLEDNYHAPQILNLDRSLYLKDIEPLDFVISIGGDGTILGLARVIGEKPILGINSGHLGFLTDIDANKSVIPELFRDIFDGNYTLDKKYRLEATVIRDGNCLQTCTALNDIIIKGAVGKLCRLKTYVNDQYVANFSADGLIIATATGATGYSLSAGGPIVLPELPINVITPICSHTLNARAIAVSNEYIIKVEVDSFYDGLLLSADGQCDSDLKSGDRICITKAKITTNLIRLANVSFYEIMTSKLKLA